MTETKKTDKLDDTQPINVASELSLLHYCGLIENLRLPSMIFDPEMKLVGINQTFSRNFQLSFDDIEASGADQFFSKDVWDRLSHYHEEVFILIGR